MSAGEVKKEIPALVFHTYPLCKIFECVFFSLHTYLSDCRCCVGKLFSQFDDLTDMPDDMKQEAMEVCTTAAEKYSSNNEQAARMIKDDMDKRFGSPFQVVVGEAYGFSVTHQEKTLLHMYTGGNIAVLIWRTVPAGL